jgi:hypothetical protein
VSVRKGRIGGAGVIIDMVIGVADLEMKIAAVMMTMVVMITTMMTGIGRKVEIGIVDVMIAKRNEAVVQERGIEIKVGAGVVASVQIGIEIGIERVIGSKTETGIEIVAAKEGLLNDRPHGEETVKEILRGIEIEVA